MEGLIVLANEFYDQKWNATKKVSLPFEIVSNNFERAARVKFHHFATFFCRC
jgi:hypothetical protein